MHGYPEGVVLEDCPCPIGCDRSDSLVLEGRDRIHEIQGKFAIVRCSHCSLMRTNPRPTPETIGAYYPSHYGPYAAEEVKQERPRSVLKEKIRRLMGLDARRIPPMRPGHLIELGCASGAYLETMRHAGWFAEGIEFSAEPAEQARAKGFNVQVTPVELATPPAQPVDLVLAWMVLEHLHSPVAVLEHLRSWIKPSGYLVASVPIHGNAFLKICGNRSYDLHLPNHLYHFSIRSLHRLLAKAGWQIEHIFWQRNANTLLWTLEYTAKDRGMRNLSRFIVWLRTSASSAKLRIGLGWLLGVCHASGRIEFWARPGGPGSAS